MDKSPHQYAIILAGGSGTRLWPLSRELSPKHLLSFSINASKTLLQETAERLLQGVEGHRIITVTHDDHYLEVLSQLRSVDSALTENILREAEAKNTLPAIAWAVEVIGKRDPDAVIGVFPSDHVIQNQTQFISDLGHAMKMADKDYIVTFGIEPTYPATGYGYIKAGDACDDLNGYKISSFVEKPDQKSAVKYLEEGKYYWNSGMFVFNFQTFQDCLEQFQPDIRATLQELVEKDPQGESKDCIQDTYTKLPRQSIDYGLMEKISCGAVLPSNLGWNDLGCWDAFYRVHDKSEGNNVVKGDVIQEDCQNSLLYSEDGFIGAIGLQDMIVIKTNDAVLISDRCRVQEVKKIVSMLDENHSTLVHSHATVKRPWGEYTVLEEGPGFKVKRVSIKPGERLSMQYHQHRSEHWVVVEGAAKVQNADRTMTLKPNESTYIPAGTKHCLMNNSDQPLQIIEVQTGPYLGEDDIVRLEDKYGRI
jgi:mannose-1-phosphate guanylyltransferase / mannose-6-phosphate isomerase